MKSTALLFALPITATALSSISANPSDFGSIAATTGPAAAASVVTESSPWRITLDIGREPLANMPFDWARSGCRMPLVIPCDFVEQKDDKKKKKNLYPQSDTVSFTGPDGAVVRPIQGGGWDLTKDNKELSFSLSFPETLARRDVTIEGGTTLELIGRVYSQSELDQLNEEFYQAREATWEVGGQLNEMANRQGAAKKWNEEKKRWEKAYPNENLFSVAQKQLKYWGAKAKQNQKNNQRPDPNTLSDRGTFPGVEKGLYMASEGVVRQSKNGPIMGKWYAQPITDTPVSYRS